MTRYVVGFLFAAPSWGLNVALIRKARPAWQVDRCNGIGGKVEGGETPADAMAREFREETGWQEPIDWQEYATLSDRRGYVVHFFRAIGSVDIHLAAEANTRSVDEPVVIWHVGNLARAIEDRKIIPNLGWLVPLALDSDIATATIVETVRA
jgi:8-oxo-dGTP diphosphatase